MTNKRFNVVVSGYCWIEETAKVTGHNGEGKYYMMSECDANNLCTILNELHEENDVLKQKLKTKAVVNRQYEELQKLNKKNKQLKQRINSRLHFYYELYETTNDDVVKRVIEDLEDILR